MGTHVQVYVYCAITAGIHVVDGQTLIGPKAA